MAFKSLMLFGIAGYVATACAADCAPGYYLPILKDFKLQLPYGSNDDPLTITGAKLSGCDGYQNSTWFYWNETDSNLVMNAPPSSSGCVKTSGSEHCRTELRESNPSSWSPSGTNTMTVDVLVSAADDGDYGTVIGQVFSADFSKPVAELYYNPSGDLHVGVEQSSSGGDEKFTSVGNVPLGTKFTYKLDYSNDALTFTLNGGDAVQLATSQLDNPNSYFKVGDYNQGKDDYSEVNIFNITIVHA